MERLFFPKMVALCSTIICYPTLTVKAVACLGFLSPQSPVKADQITEAVSDLFLQEHPVERSQWFGALVKHKILLPPVPKCCDIVTYAGKSLMGLFSFSFLHVFLSHIMVDRAQLTQVTKSRIPARVERQWILAWPGLPDLECFWGLSAVCAYTIIIPYPSIITVPYIYIQIQSCTILGFQISTSHNFCTLFLDFFTSVP